jgi:hypothetical protein
VERKITIRIGRDGKVTLHVEGQPGDQCLLLTQALEQALGGQVESREYTGDYFSQGSELEQQEELA